MPSVVCITGKRTDPATGESYLACGSGVIMSPDGYILTNRHVVKGLTGIIVTLYDRRFSQVNENDIWMDDIDDLAVFKIEANNLSALVFGDPDEIQIGDPVIASGYALGFSPAEGGATVTDGIVSNLGRSFWIDDTPYYDLIQTSAAINPGNSGGPLANIKGEVIGINSVEITTAQNIGFAISAGTARHAFEDLVKYHRVDHPYLGANLGDITMETMYRFGPLYNGAVITGLDPDGPAQAAGLEQDDVVMGFNGVMVSSASDLIKEVWRRYPGDIIEITFLRGGDKIIKEIKLDIRPSGTQKI